MRQSLSDTLPSSSATALRPKKRRWTREQLLKHLEVISTTLGIFEHVADNDVEQVLDTMPPPLPPPGRPTSPPLSPVLGHKRKSDSTTDPDPGISLAKRPRTSSVVDRRHTPSQQYQLHHTHQPPHSHQPPNAPSASSSQLTSASNPLPAFTSRQEPEEGEVREEVVAPVQAPSISTPPKSTLNVPVRRPKRGKLGGRHFDGLHDIYHAQGRKLKYSGDARFWSTYSPTHREYRPLADPPPLNSPYHKHGGLIARLELVDALICFTYSIWNKDYGRKACNKDTWSTIEAFLIWCKQKWQWEGENFNDAEKAFVGLIWMIEAFIHGRKLMYTIKDHLDRDLKHVMSNVKSSIQEAADKAEASLGGLPGSLNPNSGGTPTMLPSPASIAPTNSANSTPTHKDNGTPNSTASSRHPSNAQPARPPPQVRTGPSPVPIPLLPKQYTNNTVPIPPEVGKAMKDVREPISPTLAKNVEDFVSGYHASCYCMNYSQGYLNLPIMMRCFPNTFNRMMHSNLLPTEEHEPDFDDEEGELFWPGQLVTGEGLGWVCLMGKSMVKEFGKEYGYKGLDGVVPKPQPEGTTDGPPPSHRHPPGSSSSSHSSYTPSNSYHHSNPSHGNR